jgi:hypothetical protein
MTMDAALLADEGTIPPVDNVPEPPRRTHRRALVLIAGAVALVALVASLLVAGVGRHGSPVASSGVLRGSVPLCYGPGLDTNLTPTLLVTAERDGRVIASVRVPATDAHHAYRLTLPAGTYLVKAGGWPARLITVHAGSTTTADLPGGGCV